MKLTKKLENEIREVYDTYWDGYMKGDMEKFSVILDENVKVIGSTDGEVFFNKQDALSFYLPTADQIAGKAELRNRNITIGAAGNLVLVTEQSDFYVLVAGNWTYYAKARLSTFFHKIDRSWKIIQQHGSMPDIRAVEGEQFALEKISKENLELRDAVKRRTTELEQKNRELEIEASLERVRTVAMAMSKADDMLDVCRIISAQMGLLSLADIRNVQTAIFYPEKMIYRNYEYYRRHDKSMVTDVDYTTDKRSRTFSARMQSGAGEFFADGLSGKAVQDWYEFQKTTAQFPDSYLETAKSLTYYWFSLGPVALGCSTYAPLTEEEISLFKRFRNVFELAYRRFLDIQQAAGQAREAQIELALERVRARTMAMQVSGELAETASVLFQQIKDLGFDMWSCGFCIWSAEDLVEVWMNADSGGLLPPMMIPYKNEPTHRDIYEASLRGVLAHEQVWEGEALEMHYEFLQTIPSVKEAIDLLKRSGLTLPEKQCYYVGFFKQGYLLLITKEPKPTAGELTNRFARVFDQTYTRFLDLKKSEAQTRESQIELGLERVRARAMAMQKSDELKELIGTVFTELIKLDFVLTRCVIMIYDPVTKDCTWWMANSEAPSDPIGLVVQYHELPPNLAYLQSWQERNARWQYSLEGKMKEEWDEYLFSQTGLSKLPDFVISGMKAPDKVILSASFNNFGNLTLASLEPLSEEHFDIMLRFAKVFDLTYTRFNDLQKAESQAKESQIQLALERVRARTMAMQKSDELRECVLTIYEQLQNLDFDSNACNIIIIDKESGDTEYWVSGFTQKIFPEGYHVPYLNHPYHENLLTAYRENKKYAVMEYSGKMKQSFDEIFFTKTDFKNVPEQAKQFIIGLKSQTLSTAFFNYGALQVLGPEALSDDKAGTLQRFAIVFEQTYTRFLDLQKAEAQAREAKIEASLERVRSKAMAMHNSQDLADTIGVFYRELHSFSITPIRCGVGLLSREERMGEMFTWNTTEHGQSHELLGRLKLEGHPLLTNIYDSWLAQTEYHPVLKGAEIAEYYKVIRPQMHFPDNNHDDVQYGYFFFFNEGGVYAWTEKKMNEDELQIYRRFTSVVGLTYKRYRDLQQAEDNARESRIQLALERVRARTMAMQKSEELADAAVVLFQQFAALGELPDRISIGLVDLQRDVTDVWATDQAGTQINVHFKARNDEQTTIAKMMKAWKTGEKSITIDLQGDDLKNWIVYLRTELGMSINDEKFHGRRLHNISFFSQGWLNITTMEPLPAETLSLLDRFASVFNLTYTRFLDLQKAEAQAREAKIEAALEKVRSRTLAMQKSDELSETAAEVFRQLIALGIEPNRLYIGLVNDDNGDMEMWATDEDGTRVGKKFVFNKNENASVLKLFDGWKTQKKSVIVDMQGEELENYFHYLSNVMQIPFKGGLSQKRRVQSVAYFSKGFIGMASPDGQGDETLQLLERFAAVFNLTYTRFNDLQVAEAQTQKAKIETALERVRARALAMQQPEELKEVAAVLRHEMGLLGVEELETCSIYINDEHTEKAECWYALKDTRVEEKLVNDHFALNLNDTSVGREMLQFYNSSAMQISIVMQGEKRKEWIRYCEDNSAPFRGYYGEIVPDRTYHLYKFSHGAIGAAVAGEISSESWDLLQRAASVFSLAYSRFKDLAQAKNDLLRLKEEKQRAEDALSELQVTQKQLIQSEKMASLGELTAGIAHEIQNPLNFVNNFSEVSTELLDEMIAELDKGNPTDAITIADDLKLNLEKILHHGKRADGIVKGMLQHSRSSSGAKEPTNITVLADEYLRLAYHGLRAKDKSFNAILKTEYDEAIGDINIIPQDIGRAILNLITNAFYAVAEKKKQNGKEYEPTVSVSTARVGESVELTVIDNGNGIAPKVLEKIFQPFFTTKPTGQGTGLGLSLSYDIVKAHGGELKVETTIGEGSVFIIQLPIKSNP